MNQITTQTELRRSFWREHPNMPRRYTPQQCPRCGGKGELWYGDSRGVVNCSYCGGTGQLAARDEGDPGFLVDTCHELAALREECVALRVVAMAAQGLVDAGDWKACDPEVFPPDLVEQLRDALAALHKKKE